jgi:outer membrane protein assembly factor BamB
MTRYLSLALACTAALSAGDWGRFRGPNGLGIAETKDVPVEFGPEKNLVWRTEIPKGFSSPVLTADSVFVTAYEGERPKGLDKRPAKMFTIAIDRKTGKIQWRREAPSTGNMRSVNTPTSPTPVTDGKNVYVFFEDFGLLSYGPDGNERWKMQLGPFNDPYGMAASPILYGDTLILKADQDTNAYLMAVNTKDGKVKWKVDRPGVTHGYSTPILYEPKQGPPQIIVSGSYDLVSYNAKTGEKLWWVGGMAWQAKSTPIIVGDTLYVHSWMAGMAELGLPSVIDPFEKVIEANDADKDGKIGVKEIPYKELQRVAFLFDLDHNGVLDKDEWGLLFKRNEAVNGLYAIRLPKSSEKGDLSKSNVLWRYDKGLPNIPSPILYKGVLFVLKEGGILTSLNPATGAVIKQARVEKDNVKAVGGYFASPVATEDKIYIASADGKISVIKAQGEWEVLAINDLKEEVWSTPAIADSQLIVRSQTALYCFAKQAQ